MYAKWVQSYRDLPILINQWANVVRWEMRPRIFLRTTEFLWQEGHTAHATEEEAREETMRMLDVYAGFAENYLAMPVIKGEKSESERFPGAEATYCIEAMMQDRKALQAGTSHFLGQNFAKAAQIKYLSDQGREEYAWTTSWGVTTRLIGGVIMTHSDDDGMVMPPRLAPSHIAILPIIHKEETRAQVLEYCEKLNKRLSELFYRDKKLQVEFDTRDIHGGEKAWDWIKRGIPMVLEIGPRDVASNSVFVGRRDLGRRNRKSMPLDEFVSTALDQLEEMQKNLFDRALAFQKGNSLQIDSKEDFEAYFAPRNRNKPEIHGGFAMSHWCGSADVEEEISDKYGVSICCIPFDTGDGEGTCIFTGKPSKQRVVFAKSY
jgi:prolyl-tRNA synthetase